MPQWNGPVLTLAKIIKFVMPSASEAELGTMFITTQEMVAMRQTLQEMKWPQPKPPLQTDNSAAAGVVKRHHRPKKAEDNGPSPPLAQMQRITRPIQVLLGKWQPELGRL